jgi:hypothetical protein
MLAQLEMEQELHQLHSDIEISIEAQQVIVVDRPEISTKIHLVQRMELERIEIFLAGFKKMGRALMSAEYFLPVNDVKLDMLQFEEFLRGGKIHGNFDEDSLKIEGIGPQLDQMTSSLPEETKVKLERYYEKIH